LREFVDGLACNAKEGSDQAQDTVEYAHIDIGTLFHSTPSSFRRMFLVLHSFLCFFVFFGLAGAMECTLPDPCNPKGLTGRPVRALIEYIRQQAALH
jgi:aminopeptidase